jgi:hypothetical protein
MDVRSQLELHYTQQRERLYAILGPAAQLSLPALDLIVASFRTVTDLTELGPHCWAIMPKTDVRQFHNVIFGSSDLTENNCLYRLGSRIWRIGSPFQSLHAIFILLHDSTKSKIDRESQMPRFFRTGPLGAIDPHQDAFSNINMLSGCELFSFTGISDVHCRIWFVRSLHVS